MLMAFLNVNELSAEKLRPTINLLRFYHIIFVAETWNLNSTVTSTHPTFVASTPAIAGSRSEGGRSDGGITIFAQPDIIPSIQILGYSHHHLTISYRHGTVSVVYLPPSMPISSYTDVLQSVKTSTAVVGDFNVRYGARVGDSQTSQPVRRASLDDWCFSNGLSLVVPSTGIPRCDHLFSKGVSATSTILRAPTTTDHDLLAFDILPNNPTEETTTDTLPTLGRIDRRFHLKKLQSRDVVRQLCRNFDDTTAELRLRLEGAASNLPYLSVAERMISKDGRSSST